VRPTSAAVRPTSATTRPSAEPKGRQRLPGRPVFLPPS
jgi:hypothetical protein